MHIRLYCRGQTGSVSRWLSWWSTWLEKLEGSFGFEFQFGLMHDLPSCYTWPQDNIKTENSPVQFRSCKKNPFFFFLKQSHHFEWFEHILLVLSNDQNPNFIEMNNKWHKRKISCCRIWKWTFHKGQIFLRSYFFMFCISIYCTQQSTNGFHKDLLTRQIHLYRFSLDDYLITPPPFLYLSPCILIHEVFRLPSFLIPAACLQVFLGIFPVNLSMLCYLM